MFVYDLHFVSFRISLLVELLVTFRLVEYTILSLPYVPCCWNIRIVNPAKKRGWKESSDD